MYLVLDVCALVSLRTTIFTMRVVVDIILPATLLLWLIFSCANSVYKTQKKCHVNYMSVSIRYCRNTFDSVNITCYVTCWVDFLNLDPLCVVLKLVDTCIAFITRLEELGPLGLLPHHAQPNGGSQFTDYLFQSIYSEVNDRVSK
ncbi:hypothetical protein ACJX0J_007095 [Zea mays]